jgi:Integrase zinc binding domain
LVKRFQLSQYLPEKYRKEAMYEAHDSIFEGHNVTQKTYVKISTSYYWPKIFHYIDKHKNFCLRCQQRKKSTNKKMLLAPLPIPECPNLWIHADLFGPMTTADSKKFCFASPMHLPYMLWSQQLQIKMQNMP